MNGRTVLWRVLQAVLFAAILYGLYRLLAPQLGTLSWSDLQRWKPAPLPLLLSLIALLGFYLIHAFLWRRITIDLDVGRPDPRTTMRIYFIASLGRYIPGKLWQLAGFAVLASRAGMSPTGATAAALLGQFGFLATGMLFVAVLLPDFVSGLRLHVLGFVLVAGAGAIWLLTATPAGHKARAWIRARLGQRANARLGTALALAENLRGRDAIRWAVGYGASWILLGLAFSLFATAFVPGSLLSVRQLAGTVAASYLAGYLVLVAPAGLGVRELSMTGLLSALPGFPIEAAVLISVLSRVWFTAGELLPLLLIPLLPGPRGGGETSPVAQSAADGGRTAEGA